MNKSLVLIFLFTSPAQAGVLDRMYEIYNSTSTPASWKLRLRDEMLRYSRALDISEPSQGGSDSIAVSAAEAVKPASLSSVKAIGFAVPEAPTAVRLTDGTGVSLPEGALREDAMITVETVPETPASPAARGRAEMKLTAVSEAVEFGPPGTSFRAPVQIALAYDTAVVRAKNLKARDLKVHYWNESQQAWEPLPSTVDESARLVRAQSTHFSLYQAMGSGGIGVLATGAYGLVDVYAFPNPARGRTVTLRVQVGNADSVSVRIYDVNGRKIHEASSSSSAVVDDGNGKGAQPTHDMTWDPSGIGSGVYTYVVTAGRAGESDIKVAKKLAVIR
ncbi:MAG: T9SS type A sorting domain-containing protein [Elusimicrobiota bacterium]|nr:T9SS type A sorting domain-containing protein [Elusimicrobiota bacterium]